MKRLISCAALAVLCATANVSGQEAFCPSPRYKLDTLKERLLELAAHRSSGIVGLVARVDGGGFPAELPGIRSKSRSPERKRPPPRVRASDDRLLRSAERSRNYRAPIGISTTRLTGISCELLPSVNMLWNLPSRLTIRLRFANL